LFVILSFFYWPLHCLNFDLRLLIAPLVTFLIVLLKLIYTYIVTLY
jgi:hypothetical protein